ASHELVEAASDPLPRIAPAFRKFADADIAWPIQFGAEAADLCSESSDNERTILPADIGAHVQRIWSNTAARTGHHPCIPHVPGEVYFQAVPTLTSDVPATYQGSTVPTRGVLVPNGGSTTVDVHLVSDAPTTAPWKLRISTRGIDTGYTF